MWKKQKPIQLRILGVAMCFAASTAYADSQDDLVFGPASGASAQEARDRLEDTLQIGGRLELRSTYSKGENQDLLAGSVSPLSQADLYFDTRPTKELRGLLRLRVSQAGQTPTLLFDEMWFKWTVGSALYITAGRQHLKWGSGRIWNPTDFTASTKINPFELFDRRTGLDIVKFHFPMEKQGHNFYAVAQLDNMPKLENAGVGLRAELAFAGVAEAAFSFQTRKKKPLNFGIDVSSALGPLDVNLELALSRRHDRQFFRGGFSANPISLPEMYTNSKSWFSQAVFGVRHSWKYSDDDVLNVGAEFFFNELGYDDRELALYALVSGQSQRLQASRRYVGLTASLPTPGSWNKTSYFANGIYSLSDQTGVVQLTQTYELLRYASLEVFASRCFGDYGELCFRLPETIRTIARSTPTVPAEQKALAEGAQWRQRTSAGVGLVGNF